MSGLEGGEGRPAPAGRAVLGIAEALGVGRGDLVSLVGGGGKTTLLYRLTEELREAGLRAVAATTTKISDPGEGGNVRLICSSSYPELLNAVVEHRAETPVLGREVAPSGKVTGIPPEWCDRLVRDGIAHALVVEADGAARRPVKAPEAWEPVIPEETTVFVAVVGLSCLGKPADSATVFRSERFFAVTGAEPGEPLASDALIRLFLSSEGLLKGLTLRARAVAFLNQAELPGMEEAAARLARGILEGGGSYDRVVAGALREPDRGFEVWTKSFPC